VFTCFAKEAVHLLAPAEEALTIMEQCLHRELLQNQKTLWKYDTIKNMTKQFLGKNRVKK